MATNNLNLIKPAMGQDERVKEHCKEIESPLEYCFEVNRRASFKTWVFSDEARCSAAKLAEAGFIFVGSRTDPDAVKCFLCNKNLDSWEEDDDPWAEHRKHAPKCSFARLDKPEKELTLSEFIDIRNELIESVIRSRLMEKVHQVNSRYDEHVKLLQKA